MKWERLVALFCVIPVAIVIFTPGIYDGFFIFLVWTSALNSALSGIGIADYFLLRRQRVSLRSVFAAEGRSPFRFWGGFNPVALLALLAGFLIYVLIFNPQTLAASPLFAVLSASLPSCVLAGVVHYLLTRLLVIPKGYGDYPAAASASVNVGRSRAADR
jgi:NCS1 family nucleobase:cation symporter-1